MVISNAKGDRIINFYLLSNNIGKVLSNYLIQRIY